MKHKGPCRIRVEPHIFECEVYVEEKPKPPVQKVQQQGQYGAYGQQYRPGQAYAQQRPLGAVQQHTPVRQSPAPAPPARSQQGTPAGQPEKKAGPDPVISMLANRASSDPELKALMKEVATGAATPEQLKVFQGHIDELSKIINEKKKKDEEVAAAAEAKMTQQQQQDSIQHDGAAQPPPQPYQPQQQQQTWSPSPHPSAAAQPPSPPTAPPVILQFTTPGATEDRFLFPRNSIIEPLSPQHLLCSTFITRPGSAAVDLSAASNPEKTYFQPVTFMVEVAYGRENLIELVKKYVRSAEEVSAWMEETMQKCQRAGDGFLALRLPVKGSEEAETEEERVVEEGKGVEDCRKRGVVVGAGSGSGSVGGGVGGGGSGQGSGAHVKYVKKPGPKKGEGGRPVGVKNGEGGGKRASLAVANTGTGIGAGATVKPGGVSIGAAAGAQAPPTPALPAAGEKAKGTDGGSGETVAAGTGEVAKQDNQVKEKTAGARKVDELDAGADAGVIAEAEKEKEKEKEKENAKEKERGMEKGMEKGEEKEEEESGRPKRTVRKSVRISES